MAYLAAISVRGIGNREQIFERATSLPNPRGLALAGKRQLATNAPMRPTVAPCRLKGVAGQRILEVAEGRQSGRALAGQGQLR